MGCLGAEDRNSVGKIFPREIGRNKEGLWHMPAQMEQVGEEVGCGDGFQE